MDDPFFLRITCIQLSMLGRASFNISIYVFIKFDGLTLVVKKFYSNWFHFVPIHNIDDISLNTWKLDMLMEY